MFSTLLNTIYSATKLIGSIKMCWKIFKTCSDKIIFIQNLLDLGTQISHTFRRLFLKKNNLLIISSPALFFIENCKKTKTTMDV